MASRDLRTPISSFAAPETNPPGRPGKTNLNRSMMSASETEIRAANDEAIGQAAARLAAGGLVAFPTETVYGLGADATSDAAVAALFAAKERPAFNPLIVHVADSDAAEKIAEFDDRTRRLGAAFWPGALTIIRPRRAEAGISLLVSAGLETVAVRVPAHAVAHDLLIAAERPIAAPSANRSGHVSPTTASHVAASLGGRIDMIIDGGPCRVGIESTVVDLTDADAVLLRPGGIAAEEIEAVIGPLAAATHAADGEAPRSPGMLERHYAPAIPVRPNATQARPGEVLLGFGPLAPDQAPNLSPDGDVIEAAANLFAMLHALDQPDHIAIAVMPIPETGLGQAINDRLRRAAAD
jgi:L-threonylcarbamoyladenylate synthase